jgi:hypothetical protein
MAPSSAGCCCRPSKPWRSGAPMVLPPSGSPQLQPSAPILYSPGTDPPTRGRQQQRLHMVFHVEPGVHRVGAGGLAGRRGAARVVGDAFREAARRAQGAASCSRLFTLVAHQPCGPACWNWGSARPMWPMPCPGRAPREARTDPSDTRHQQVAIRPVVCQRQAQLAAPVLAKRPTRAAAGWAHGAGVVAGAGLSINSGWSPKSASACWRMCSLGVRAGRVRSLQARTACETPMIRFSLIWLWLQPLLCW